MTEINEKLLENEQIKNLLSELDSVEKQIREYESNPPGILGRTREIPEFESEASPLPSLHIKSHRLKCELTALIESL